MEEGPIEPSVEKGFEETASVNQVPFRTRGINAYEAVLQAEEALTTDGAAISRPNPTHSTHNQAGSTPAVPPQAPSSRASLDREESFRQPTYSSGSQPVGTAAYISPPQPVSRTAAQHPQNPHSPHRPQGNSRFARYSTPDAQPSVRENSAAKGLFNRWHWGQKRSEEHLEHLQPSDHPPGSFPEAPPKGRYVVDPVDGRMVFVPESEAIPLWWKKQPYYAIAYALAISGTVMGAWLFGVLVAQILPGNFAKPPLQESMLRKTSRLSKSLWHFPQLWQSQTTETRIEAIPLPDTGPVIEPIRLPPIERQPLIDELNAIETEVLTLDRRIEILEKRLGRPPYEGADIDQRLQTLRMAIDPPVNKPVEVDYTPEVSDPSDRILDVAERKITLPADALFAPGDSAIKDATILNQVLDQLVNYPGATVVVSSYSDDQANSDANREYTLAQSNALSRYLQASLPEKYRWITVGGGETRPVDSNQTPPGRQRNRRIEILIDTR